MFYMERKSLLELLMCSEESANQRTKYEQKNKKDVYPDPRCEGGLVAKLFTRQVRKPSLDEISAES